MEKKEQQSEVVVVETAPGKEKEIDSSQKIEVDAYVPTYKIKPEFKQAVLQSIGDRPFNEIIGLISAINVPVMDHNTLQQVIKVLGNFPYLKMEKLLLNINSFVEQILPE